MEELYILELLHIPVEHLAVIGNDGAVIVVLAGMLVDIVCGAGAEDGRKALVKKLFDMSVHDFCRIAYRVGGDGELSLFVRRPR